jgi:hypothetical protein
MERTSAASWSTSTKPVKKESAMPNAILDPTGAVTTKAKPAAPRAKRPASLKGARVGLLINTKQNAAPFLHEVGRLLVENYGVASLTERTKKNFAMPEADEVIKEMAEDADVIITGVGDCGSCSAAAAADGVVFEAAGVPTAVIVTESFRATTEAMAELRGAPGFPYATTAHPVAVLTEDKVKERAAGVVGDVVSLLTDPRA